MEIVFNELCCVRNCGRDSLTKILKSSKPSLGIKLLAEAGSTVPACPIGAGTFARSWKGGFITV